MPRRNHNVRRRMEGRCIDCGALAEYGRTRCEGCLMRQRLQKKEKYGEKKRMLGDASHKNLLKFNR